MIKTMKNNWQGKRVVIIGAARQGTSLARYLARHNADVVLNDRRPPEQLKTEMESLAGLDIEWATSGHSVEIMEPRPDLVCISGGIPLNNPLVKFALSNNIQISNDTQVFLDAAPCKTVGITGSAGKTTTTTLVGRMSKADNQNKYRKIWIGGNIGDPLLNYVDDMQPSDLAILEISSFQSEIMTSSPHVSAILNITPNHLDRHETMKNYISAKAQLINFQSSDDIAILGRDDQTTWALAENIRGHLYSFGFSSMPTNQNGMYCENGKFFFRQGNQISYLPVEDLIELRGEHNRLNTMAACAIAYSIGLSPEAMANGVKGFRGVAHRLEFVRTWHGADWYNDSIATAPERTIAAIRSFGGPIILLLGGRDKDLPWNALGSLIRQRVEHVILFGEATEKIHSAIIEQNSGPKPLSLIRSRNCHDAVTAASRLAQPGFTVLFSPGGTSYDEFKDFEERGERYKQWVLEFSETLQ